MFVLERLLVVANLLHGQFTFHAVLQPTYDQLRLAGTSIGKVCRLFERQLHVRIDVLFVERFKLLQVKVMRTNVKLQRTGKPGRWQIGQR